MVLPTMPKNTLKNIESVIREFLWNGKKAKIALGILQNPKRDGGLNLVNLRNKEKSLKATWPQILYQEEEYAEIVYKQLRMSVIKEDIWRANLRTDDVKTLKIQNTFWEDVLSAWTEFNAYKNKRVENQIIWYNSEIKLNNKVFMWKDVYDKGLKYVHQLFENKKFKSQQEVWQQYGLTKLRFNSLKVAIPTYFKEFFYNIPEGNIYPHTSSQL